LYRDRVAPVSAKGFKTSDIPLAERSAACLLLLELESRGLVIEGAGGWVAATPDKVNFQEYTDSDWLDHRSAKNGRA
jgi:dethiobiotin synthetase